MVIGLAAERISRGRVGRRRKVVIWRYLERKEDWTGEKGDCQFTFGYAKGLFLRLRWRLTFIINNIW